jgi:hypothetical protein
VRRERLLRRKDVLLPAGRDSSGAGKIAREADGRSAKLARGAAARRFTDCTATRRPADGAAARRYAEVAVVNLRRP